MARPISIAKLEEEIAADKKDLERVEQALRAKIEAVKAEKERLATKRALDIGRMAMACGLTDVSDGDLEKFFMAYTPNTSEETAV